MSGPFEDELYDDGRHCACGELIDDYGFCPACDAGYWDQFDDGDDDDEADDYGNKVYFGLDEEEDDVW